MADHEMKANDLLPVWEGVIGHLASPTADTALSAVLADPDTEVSFIMRKQSGATTTTVNAPAIIADAATRTIRYEWTLGDSAIPGAYNVEVEVTDPNGRTQTFPTSGYSTLTIHADLDAAP